MAENKLHRFCDNGNTIKVAMMQDVAGLDWEAVPIAPHGDPLHDDNSWVIADTFDKVPVPGNGQRSLSELLGWRPPGEVLTCP